MEKSYPHIHKDFQDILKEDILQRATFFNKPHIIDYDYLNKIIAHLAKLLNMPKRPRMYNLFLVGDSGNGKTTLIKKFYEEYGEPYINSRSEGVRPIILMQTPNKVNEKSFYISLVERFFVGYETSESALDLKFKALDLLQEYKTKMLIIENIHSLLIATPRMQRQIMNNIKYLGNILQIPIVGVGARDSIQLLHLDPQYASRFDVISLPSWQLDKDFEQLLIDFEKFLPLKKPSFLHEPKMASLLYQISGGNLGDLYQLLSDSAVIAMKTGEERITVEILEQSLILRSSKDLEQDNKMGEVKSISPLD